MATTHQLSSAEGGGGICLPLIYVVMALRSKDQNNSFVHYYCKFEVEIVKIALAHGACKQQDATTKLKAERRQLIQRTDLFVGILTSIPGIDTHDANSLLQAIGSVEAIARASRETILEKTDLSPEEALAIQRFFRDPKYYLTPKLT